MIVSTKRFILNSIMFMGWELLKELLAEVLLDASVSTQYALLILLPFQLDSEKIFRVHLVETAWEYQHSNLWLFPHLEQLPHYQDE